MRQATDSIHRIVVGMKNSVTGLVQSPARTSSEGLAKLRAIGQDPQLDYRVTLDRIFRETCNHLDSLGRHVGEGMNFLEVSLFLRWLEFSGVMELLSRHALPGQDFGGLRLKLDDLMARCRPLLQGQRVKNTYSEPDIVSINRKLDDVLAALARPATVTSVVKMISGRCEKQLSESVTAAPDGMRHAANSADAAPERADAVAVLAGG